ncbi:hypothetical protein KC342_g2875 [Hortaea werneckii]|nr:hypothetical protein KC342_g2875 [Hortaea werneckii]KAI7103805.1 hypothetical protein KC339_g4984 [Hortaea werneckii]
MLGFFKQFLPKEDRHSALMLYGMCIALCFNGYDAGIMTVILADDQFNDYYNMNANRQGLVAIIPWAATALSQVWFGGWIASMLGRLWALRISISIMIAGVVIQIVPNTYGVLVFGRLLTGLGFGANYIATNLYVAECAPRVLRGSFVGTVSQFGYQLGTFIAFWSGYGMNDYREPYNIAWRISNFIQIPFGVFFIILSLWYPESPRYLLEKHGDTPEIALNTLAKIRSGDPQCERVQTKWQEILTAYEFRRRYEPGYLGIFKNKAMLKRLGYGFYAAALQQFGGIAALTMYAALIYESLGWNDGRQALALNGIQASLQLVIVLVNTFTVDKYGRKTLLIYGFGIQALALLVCSSLTTAFPDNNNTAAAVVEVAMLFIVGLTYCWSNGPIAAIVASEIFPTHVRDKAFGISMLGQTVFLITIGQPWPLFNGTVGGLSYWLLFALNFVAMISVVFILPETKGVSLERMDAIFGDIDAVAAGEVEEAAHGKVELDKVDRVDTAEQVETAEVTHKAG